MNIVFDEDKEYTVEELNNIYNDVIDMKYKITDRINKLEIYGCDFTNKYIHIPDYGYMYVTWQKYDEDCPLGGDRMLLQGLYYNCVLNDYRDDSYFKYDALHEWYIPIDIFKRYIKNGDIKVITKEEFMKNVREPIVGLYNEIETWIESLDKTQKKS